jgi:hypothetical protein
MLSQKLWYMSALASSPTKTTIGGVNPPLSLLSLLLSATWSSSQVQAVI